MMRPLALGMALASVAGPVAAETDLISGDQLRGFIDFRAGASDGEQSWIDGGFGKTRFSGGGEEWAGRFGGQAALLWRPHLAWGLDGYLHVQSEPHQDHAIDVVEAFVSYRPMPIDGWRLSGRAGLMYPPISLEHDGAAWSLTNTLTPSAINTWVGEEVKVLGVEGSVRRAFENGQQASATLGLFGYNDTSGTLLSYRGWAMHDILTTAFGDFPLPRRSLAWQTIKASQAPTTEPTRELDDRVGYYARFEWRPIGPLMFDVFHYDNAGDRVGLQDGQWSWETRFTNLGMRARLGEDTHLLAQIMTGQTIYGQRTPFGYYVDMDFNAAYALLTHEAGPHTYSGRIDLFETIDRSFTALDNNDEDGWAATAAYRFALTPRVSLGLEGVHVESERPSRADVGLPIDEEQTTLQSALQVEF